MAASRWRKTQAAKLSDHHAFVPQNIRKNHVIYAKKLSLAKCKKRLAFCRSFDIILLFAVDADSQKALLRIGVMAAQQTLTLLVEVRVLYP